MYGDDYSDVLFKRAERKIDPKLPLTDDDEIVIEYGFNLFILTNILMLKNPKPQESELEDVKTIIEKYQMYEDKDDEDLFG